jgi:intracellular sulfur oxidation DsrE/DsrF family protein
MNAGSAPGERFQTNFFFTTHRTNARSKEGSMNRFTDKTLLAALLLVLCFFIPQAGIAKIDNDDALKGPKVGKALFDINVGKPEKLALYLGVITQTYDDLASRGFKPDFIIAFRGASVRLISNDIGMFSDEDREKLKKSADMIKKLKSQGVHFEACNIATSVFKVKNDSIMNEIKVVGNTFVSLIAYQSQGYNSIPIH